MRFCKTLWLELEVTERVINSLFIWLERACEPCDISSKSAMLLVTHGLLALSALPGIYSEVPPHWQFRSCGWTTSWLDISQVSRFADITDQPGTKGTRVRRPRFKGQGRVSKMKVTRVDLAIFLWDKSKAKIVMGSGCYSCHSTIHGTKNETNWWA